MVQKGVLRLHQDWPALEATSSPAAKDENGSEPLGFILSMEGADPVLFPSKCRNGGTSACIIGPARMA